MRILFSLTYFTPYVSGLTLYVKRLASALVKNGHTLSVISWQYKKELKKEERIKNIRIVRVKPLFPVSKGFLSFDWGAKCLKEVQHHDVTVVNLPQFEAVLPTLFAKIFGKKLITIYHCEVVLPFSFGNKVIESFLTLSHLFTLSFSDTIVTYTKDFAIHSRLLSFFSKKVRYVYPPIPKPKINKRVQKMIRGKIGGKPRFLIGVAARLAAEKGMEYLFETIPLLKDKFKIIVAGSLSPVGEQQYKEKIVKLVQRYKDYIIFLGELKEEEMGSFYSLLDVLVLPSINSTEAFGMVQVEAMMMGVPVVASNLPGVRVPVQQAGMGRLVVPKNSEKLASAIGEVLANKKKYIKNKKKVEKEFALEKTVKFYISLLGSPIIKRKVKRNSRYI